ncbi:LOW QUALITY PROTEIN: uncharacterized protein LOC123516523 [Portunus trituberculatus]|uniref:LOW QUALITY PROTEIN: uncharacterized protein LOC123516523 n=1 Tax=Portunus trituberculatus TaxID=210409 RepID=UPI001E1CB57E|nr:LOW QUALITY PROTEIN: uncharacterized protein LOC123516523 [Portunus trituberculatus]
MNQCRLIFSDYQIIRELGSGSYGSAHLAHHVPSDTKHVIKRIKISHMTPKEVQTARQEVQVLSSLSHPYITQFRGSCEEDGYLLIAMDYCAGGDLHSIITKRNGILFPEDRVLDWFAQLCLAIKYIHDHKILHRDIKSQNIFLTDDGKVRLGDFGISKILNSSSELARTCIGTPYYLSPEMCENKPYNNKSDIWALGCVLYEMLTLKHAFEANNMKALILKIIKGIYPPVAPRYSRDIRLLLSQIFQREPQARPSICAVLRKPFILKRLSKFIPGCEEEELRESLIKRKYHVPASARSKVVLNRRPPDITDPAAKYGVSLNRKVTHKSPLKSVARLPKQAISNGKQVTKITHKSTARQRQDSRKRFPSEDILSSKDVQRPEVDMSGKRYQKRSKSVPNAFRQINNPRSQYQYNKIMKPSPVKLKLMLDSSGLKRKKKDDAVDKDLKVESTLDEEESCESPRSPGWLADEFLTKKLKAVYDKRKLVEALMVDEASAAASCNGAVAKCMLPDEDVFANCVGKPSDNDSEKNVLEMFEKPKMCKPETKHSRVELPNPKDVKELANQSLKLQDKHCSENDESSDAEETLPDMSPQHLREVMQKKLKNLVEERTKKMSQMVSERRQWAYEMEKLSTSVSQSNDEVLKSVNVTSHVTDKEEKTHHKSKKYKKLHKAFKQCDSTVCLGGQTDKKHDKAPITATTNKTHLPVEEDCTLQQVTSYDITSDCTDTQRDFKFSPHDECDMQETENKPGDMNKEKDAVKDIGIQDNISMNKVSSLEVNYKEDSLLGDGNSELVMAQGSSSTVKAVIPQEPTSKDMVKSNHLTPSMRARWGAVHTADLEKSPLETTASEMDTTTSSDCVFVYREAGERKHWKKECGDIVSLLAEAQIIEDKKVVCDMEEENSQIVTEKSAGKESLKRQQKPAQMNSTFTLKEGLQNCEGDSCICKSHINITKNVHKFTVLNGTFKIDKSNFEKEMKSIGPPLLNSTFDMSKLPCDEAVGASVPVTMNNTYDIGNKNSVTTEEKIKKIINTTTNDTNILKKSEHNENLYGTYTISSDSKESEHSTLKSEVLVNERKVVTKEGNSKTKGGLLEKLRLHLTPQLKNKYHKLDSNNDESTPPLATTVDSRSLDSGLDSGTKGMHTPACKRKGSMKLGISGILRRLSSKHVTKTPTRSKSVEMVGKYLGSFEDCDTTHSDSDSPQQEGIQGCETVKFTNAGVWREADQKVVKHASGSEDNCKFVSKTSKSGDKFKVLEEDEISVNNHPSANGRDDDSNHKTCATAKDMKQSGGEGTNSNFFTNNSTMSTDSGIDSQKTSICQTSSTDCSNTQILLHSPSGESRNETGTRELLMTNGDQEDCVTSSNFYEAATSTVLILTPQIKQEKDSANTTQKCLSSHTQDLGPAKTVLLDATPREKFQDISPVSTSGIHISLKIPSEQKDGALHSKNEHGEPHSKQIEQTELEAITQTEPKVELVPNVEQDLQKTLKITSCNEVSNNQYKQENSQSSSDQPILPHSPARPRPTKLNISNKTTDVMQAPQHSASRHYNVCHRKCKQSKVCNVERNKTYISSERQEHINRTEDKMYVNVYSDATTSHNVKPHVKDLFFSSDEESEDPESLPKSVDYLITSGEHRREGNKRTQSELWHLDRDGGVVLGGGGVYGWIEEQRAKLEDELSLELFIEAYHILEAAQEREGCVVGESVSQVESLLGPHHYHLAYDILQLVVAESVYHD